MRRIAGTVALLVLSAATQVGFAAGKNIDTTVTPHTMAAKVDFAKELGVDNRSVTSLGSQIDSARMDADPIALATLANELAALEKATGKTADIKSDDLMTEAVDLAKQRHHSTELKTVAALLPGHADELNKAADEAAKMEADAKTNKGNNARGVAGTLHIDSRSTEPMDVYIDGIYVGRIPSGGDGYFAVGQPYGTTTMFVRGVWDGGTWSGAVSDVVGDWTWTLHD